MNLEIPRSWVHFITLSAWEHLVSLVMVVTVGSVVSVSRLGGPLGRGAFLLTARGRHCSCKRETDILQVICQGEWLQICQPRHWLEQYIKYIKIEFFILGWKFVPSAPNVGVYSTGYCDCFCGHNTVNVLSMLLILIIWEYRCIKFEFAHENNSLMKLGPCLQQVSTTKFQGE